jgi:hypothetical protein
MKAMLQTGSGNGIEIIFVFNSPGGHGYHSPGFYDFQFL